MSARVTWTASAADGDSPITGQTVTPYIGATAQTPVQVGAAATSATVTGLTNGTSYTFRVTATNAVGTSPASAASNAVTPQSTIFDFTTPVGNTYVDHTPVELGVKFTADFTGTITGVRFYKAAENVGTHVGSLWSAAGQRLAQATFTNETASGWQAVTFATPIAVTAGTTYVASYFSPRGRVHGDGLRPRARRSTAAPSRPSRTATAPTASTPTARRSNFPASSYDARELLGRRACTRCRRPASRRRERRGQRRDLGDGELDRAGGRRAGHLVPHHALRGRDGPDGRRRSTAPATPGP